MRHLQCLPKIVRVVPVVFIARMICVDLCNLCTVSLPHFDGIVCSPCLLRQTRLRLGLENKFSDSRPAPCSNRRSNAKALHRPQGVGFSASLSEAFTGCFLHLFRIKFLLDIKKSTPCERGKLGTAMLVSTFVDHESHELHECFALRK